MEPNFVYKGYYGTKDVQCTSLSTKEPNQNKEPSAS